MRTENKLLLYLVALILGNLLVFSFLGAMFCREAVKKDLSERGCTPVRIWWIPCGWLFSARWHTWFRAIYRDANGLIHKARCYVYASAMDTPLSQRHVRWMKDEILSQSFR